MYDEGFFLIIFVGGILVGDGFEVGGGVFDVQGFELDMFIVVSSELVLDCW